MSKFVEVVAGFAVNIESIVTVKAEGGFLTIQTEAREFEVQGDFKLFLEFLQADEIRKERTERYTQQFFGG